MGKTGKGMKRVSLLLAVILLLTSATMTFAAEKSTNGLTAAGSGAGVQYDTDAKTANVVIFAHFTDDTQESADAYFADKYETFKDYYVGSYGRAFVNYLKTVSGGKHTVNVCFPQEQSDGTISSIALPISQAEAKITNYDAQVIDAVLKAMPSLSNLSVDMDGDGYIDNLTIICKAENCSEGVEQGATLVAHSSNSGNMGTVSGYKVCNYNMLNTDRLEVTKYGLIIHEYLHTLGFPDLYRTDGSRDYPVYIWDIMASVSDSPSYPLTYLRSKVAGWMDLGEITESGTYTLSAQTAEGGTKGFVIQSPLRDKEVFVVEYRKRPTNLYDKNSLDRMVQGSGIIVYRVDTTVQDYSNSKGYTGVYVFRPVEGMTGYNPSNGLVNVVNAYLSEEAGRTYIGSADLEDGLEQGALTFSNGENSGIVISQVGSAAGDTISFKVTFPDLTDVDLWTNTNFTSHGSVYSKGVTIAQIGEDVLAVEYDGSSFTAYKENGDSWSAVSGKLSASNYAGQMKLFAYHDRVYLMYLDYADGLVVKELNLTNGSWSAVTSLSTYGSYFDLAQMGDTVYVSALQGDRSDEAHLYVFDGSKLTDQGTYHKSSFSNGEQRVLDLNGALYVFVRDASGNVLNGYRYANGSFSKITDDSILVNAFDAAVSQGTIYLASVDAKTSCLQVSSYDGTGWNTQKTDIDSAEATLTVMDDHVYVLASPSSGDGNFRMYSFVNEEVAQEGDTAIDAAASGFTAISVGNKIYLSYIRMADKMTLIKSKVASGSRTETEPEVVPSNKKDIAGATVANDENGVQVVYEGITLVQDVDYTVTDIEGIACITGIGADYTGSQLVTFADYCRNNPVLFATHNWDAGVITKEASVLEEGTKSYTCIWCGAAREESIPKLSGEISVLVSAQKGSTAKKLTLTGRLEDYNTVILRSDIQIKDHGLVYMTKARLGSRTLTISTAGRTKVSFSGYKEDGSFRYTMNTAGASVEYVVRAYITYLDLTSGATKIVYSDSIIVSRNTVE